MRFHIPIVLPSLANTRMVWQRMARLKKKQKQAVSLCIRGLTIPPLPLIVSITRVGPRRLDDDNLASACKYVRDEIARKVGVDDGSDQYSWQYYQRTSSEYGVDVEIVTRGDGL